MTTTPYDTEEIRLNLILYDCCTLFFFAFIPLAHFSVSSHFTNVIRLAHCSKKCIYFALLVTLTRVCLSTKRCAVPGWRKSGGWSCGHRSPHLHHFRGECLALYFISTPDCSIRVHLCMQEAYTIPSGTFSPTDLMSLRVLVFLSSASQFCILSNCVLSSSLTLIFLLSKHVGASPFGRLQSGARIRHLRPHQGSVGRAKSEIGARSGFLDGAAHSGGCFAILMRTGLCLRSRAFVLLFDLLEVRSCTRASVQKF